MESRKKEKAKKEADKRTESMYVFKENHLLLVKSGGNASRQSKVTTPAW